MRKKAGFLFSFIFCAFIMFSFSGCGMLSDSILNERPQGPVNEHRTDDEIDTAYDTQSGDAADMQYDDDMQSDDDTDAQSADVADAQSDDTAENPDTVVSEGNGTDTAVSGDGPNISVHYSDTSSGSGSASSEDAEDSFELSFDPADRPNATLGTGTIKELEVGDIAPDFTVTLTNGELFDLSDHDDKVVLINFWATWCSPCVGEMPELEELANEGLDKFELVCINCGEDQKTVDKFVSKNGFDFNIAYDTDYTVEYYYPTDYIPYTVVIKNGIVRDIYVGAPRDAYGTYKSSVETLLNE